MRPHHHPAVAEAAQVLGREEGEGAGDRPASPCDPLAARRALPRADRLRRVLDDFTPCDRTERAERGQLGQLPKEVDGITARRTPVSAASGRRGVEIEGVGADVGEDRARADVWMAPAVAKKVKGVVTTRRPARHRARAARGGWRRCRWCSRPRVGHAEVGRDLFFETVHHGAEHEALLVDDGVHRGVYLRGNAAVLRDEIQKRNVHGKL